MGSNINGRDSVFMLNIDSELGLAMSIMNQLGKKRQTGLEQVSEVIASRSQRSRRPTGEQEKSEAEYIEIIDKLTREMFDYGPETEKAPYQPPPSLPSSLTRSESEYERVMRELDQKLRNTTLEISQVEKAGQLISARAGTTKPCQAPSLETIDKLFDPPDKICIPSRYQPQLDVEEEEEEEERNEKSCEMRRLVSHLTGQSEERISKNQEIARLAVTKSFLLAGQSFSQSQCYCVRTSNYFSASAKSEDNPDTDDYCDDSDGDVDLSPLALPIHQQRDSLIL